MRQAGVLAAAGVVALETMVERIGDDHRRSKALARGLAPIPGLHLELGTPHTNMLFVSLDQHSPMSTEQVIKRLAERGVLIDWAGERLFRLVTHYWIDDEDVTSAIAAFSEVLC